MNPSPLAEQLAERVRRRFIPEQHQRDMLRTPLVEMRDENGNVLPGIKGRPGAWGTTIEGHEFGADVIEMQPGSAFPFHTHPGDHLLFILRGMGFVHIDGKDRHVATGDTVFIGGDHVHGVKTDPQCTTTFVFLAAGHPHKHIGATDRMTLVDPARNQYTDTQPRAPQPIRRQPAELDQDPEAPA